MFTYKFVDTIFERSVTLVVGSPKEFGAYMKSLGIRYKVEADSCGETSTHMLSSEIYNGTKVPKFFIWLIRFDGSPRDISVLTHECKHATQRALESVNVTYYEDDDNETYAHYQDAMVRQFLNALWGKEAS